METIIINPGSYIVCNYPGIFERMNRKQRLISLIILTELGGAGVIRIAICDDDKYMSDHIRKLASEFFNRKNMEITIRQFSCGEELLKYDRQIDILFLDIKMKDMNGMETARKLRERKFRGFLIFITVLKEMVFQSFEVQAYDYLVKPVEKNTLKKQWSVFMFPCRMPVKPVYLYKRDMRAVLFLWRILFSVKLLIGKYI